jgi:hypothetical protein
MQSDFSTKEATNSIIAHDGLHWVVHKWFFFFWVFFTFPIITHGGVNAIPSVLIFGGAILVRSYLKKTLIFIFCRQNHLVQGYH